MDKAKKIRTVQRCAFSKVLNGLVAALEEECPNRTAICNSFELLEGKFAELKVSDERILSLLTDRDASEEEIVQEIDSCDEYKVKFIGIKNKVALESNIADLSIRGIVTDERPQNSFRLPKIELKKFSGDIKDWLQFWSQFKKIHMDNNVALEDKFQYLIQTMVPGSRAYELVQSFPPTAENYEKVIASLKNRFGREELQVEVYVRELLKLVLQNAIKPREKVQLSSLYDKIESHLRALETLGVTTDKCAAMLYPLVESSLPEDVLRAWQRSGMFVNNAPETKDRLTQLIEFLQTEVENEQRISMAVQGFDLQSEKNTKKPKVRADNGKDIPSATGLFVTKTNRGSTCIFCSEPHTSSVCEKARAMDEAERHKVIREKGACFRCLKPGHFGKQCRVQIKCGWCGRRHTTLMCPDRKKSIDEKKTAEGIATPPTENNLASLAHSPDVFLQTLRIKMYNGSNQRIIRAIVDTGSHRSYVLKSAAEEMGYESVGEHRVTHSLFGGVESEPQEHNWYYVRLSSLDGKYACRFKVLDQDVICGEIPSIKNGLWCEELEKLHVNISDYGRDAAPIALLIGADVAGKLLTGNRKLLNCGLVAVETCLGWTIMGKVPTDKGDRCDTTVTQTSLLVRNEKIEDLWHLDVLGIRDPAENKSRKDYEEEVLRNLRENVHVNSEGRYEVELPWTANHPALSDNCALAQKRLTTTVKRLKAEGYFADYDQVLKEWKAEGICEEVPENEIKNWGHYLPHRHVVKEGSTTRIRPVFDASARDGKHPSLNECLEKGPNMIELIASILMRFRIGEIGVIADIRKAFLQISIHEKERNYLRFLWVDSNENLIHLRHTRVVFGVTSSPFILSAIIDLHLRSSMNNANGDIPIQSLQNIEQLLESLYIDNCVASVNSHEQLQAFISDAKTVMEKGGFDLRGWESSGDGSDDERCTVLGMVWNKKGETLALNLPVDKKPKFEKVTKRVILSFANRIFDPLGLVCPVLLFPRLMLRKIWADKIPWDQEVKPDLKDRFYAWIRAISELDKVKVDRCFLGLSIRQGGVSLHTFCDASQAAYATAIFLRVETPSGTNVHFVQAKNRVAPIKEITIPRLELLAATIAARLTTSVLESLRLRDVETFFWSDSSTVIAWIQRECHWSTFVNNRVQEIRRLTDPARWFHVPGENNPADLPSRGCSVKTLIAEKWWEGPLWLKNSRSEWPNSNFSWDEAEIEREKRKSIPGGDAKIELNNLSMSRTTEIPWYAKRFSTYNSILRLIGWIKRFCDNCRRRTDDRAFGELQASEVIAAEITLLKIVQSECFADNVDKRLKQLASYKDDKGLIRVNTKVLLREDTLDFRCPIVLPSDHQIVPMLILDKHKRLCHAGVQITISNLRERYWILGGRKTVRRALSQCMTCRRHDSTPLQTAAAPLPVDRVRDAAVFEVVGVDFAGPVFLRGGQKAWVCLFTCAVYRAVHLELATSLSTASFIEIVRRFIARRGRPSIVYSDNGKNFTGVSNLLRRVDVNGVVQFASTHQIEWKFNPPTAAWWGGWWERLIGVLKRLLKRSLRNACLTYEEMCTVLCDCEAVVNSRPITFMSDAKQSNVPLTPSMFLQEIKEVGVPDCDFVENTQFGKRFLYRQKVKEDLRRRFRREYLSELILRKNKLDKQRDIKIGDIVFIEKENVKRMGWPLARIKEVFIGKGGKVRLVKLVTASGELLRPIQRIYPLEILSETGKNDVNRNESNKEACDTNSYISKAGRVIKRPIRLGYEK